MRKAWGQLRLHREFWLVIHPSDDLGRYYREGFNWHNRFNGLRLGDTKWGPHVSIVRNEIPPNIALWNLYHEQDIEFEYEPIYRTNGHHVWFNVCCDAALEIRRRLRLPRLPYYNLHLTIGCYHRRSKDDTTLLTIPPTLIEGDNAEVVVNDNPICQGSIEPR